MATSQKITIEAFTGDSVWLVIDGKEYWAPFGDLVESDTGLHRSYLEKAGEFQAAVKSFAEFIDKHPVEPTP